MDSQTLKISVVMCTYNGARFLREQLDTILAQSYPVYEIVVQDDGSKDDTWSILEEYASKCHKMKIHHNDTDIHGINGNFFSAMARAEGDYIAICDQDDLWETDKLKWQAEAIGDKMVCTGFSVPFSTDGFPVKFDPRVPNFHLIRNTYLSQVPGHTMLLRKDVLKYLPEGAKMKLYYDWQIACVASAAESVVFVDKTLVHFRRHEDANTATMPVDNRLMSSGAWDYIKVSLFKHRALQNEVRNRFRIVKPFLESLPFDTDSLKSAIRMSELHLRKGPIAFLKRMCFFVKHSHHIFHTEEQRPLVRIMRAAFFTFSCGYYYRNHLNNK